MRIACIDDYARSLRSDLHCPYTYSRLVAVSDLRPCMAINVEQFRVPTPSAGQITSFVVSGAGWETFPELKRASLIGSLCPNLLNV